MLTFENVSLNCMVPLICEFFFFTKYVLLYDLRLVESVDVELWV